MKRLLFVQNNLQIGGVQRALVNLLWELAPRYEITLFLLAPEGPLLDALPPQVAVRCANPLVRVLGMSQASARQTGLLPALWRGLLVVLTRLFTTRLVFPLLSRMQSIGGVYDVAISYLHNEGPRCFYGGCAELVLHAVQARRKVCFVHCDLERAPGNCPYNLRTLVRFDGVAAVSDAVAENVRRTAPQLEGKVFAVHNCFHQEEILRLAHAYDAPYTPGVINLFSAARLSPEKGIARMIPLLAELRDTGFVWRIAGSGPERDRIQRQIASYGLQEKVILLGEQSNPYPYFRRADALLVLSCHEAAPMVFGEAQILGTPILTTGTCSAAELVARPNLGRVLAEDTLLRDLAQVLREFDQLRFAHKPLDNRRAVEEFERLIQPEGRESTVETIQVLCATTGQRDFSLVESLNLQTGAVIANQNGQDRTEVRQFGPHTVRMVSTSTQGVGVNRNLALAYATADLCLLADDDIRYVDGYPALVREAFAQNPEADVLLFNLYNADCFQIPRRTRVRWYNFMRYATYQIAFRTAPVQRRGIWFNPSFGGGCRYQSGEDTLFLRDCLRARLNMVALPLYFASMKHERPSTWFRGYNRRFFYDKGALFAAVSRRFGWLLCLRMLLTKREALRASGLPFWTAYSIMLDGMRSYRE